MRAITRVAGAGPQRKIVLVIDGYPPVTIAALAKVLGQKQDTLRKRLRNWDDPELICSRGSRGGVPLPPNKNWASDILAAAAISQIPEGTVVSTTSKASGWGFAQ